MVNCSTSLKLNVRVGQYNPYDRRTYFGAWLQAQLEEAAPQRKWEIINCGGISYASYRVALLMQELVRYQPDMFIIYTGQNEFLEDRTYGDIRDQHPVVRRLLRIASCSRSFSLLQRTMDRQPPPTAQLSSEVSTKLEVVGPEGYHRDDKWHLGVVLHFRSSLRRMAHIARSAGVRVILVVPASNLTDFTPFKSEHSPLNAEQLQQWESYVAAGRNARARGQPDRAVELLSAAQRLDPRHAEGLWLLADALLAAGHEQEAMRHFTRAKDEDVCPLRALSAIEDAVRRVAAEEGLELVDFPRLLEDKYGVVSSKGLDCFLDHVHPTPMCHGDLGWALGQELQALGVVDTIRDSPEFRERIRARVMGQITSVDNVMALHVLAMTLAWAGKNKEALRLTEVAAKALPNDPDVLSQYGRLLEKQGQETKALEVYQQAVKADPKHARALARLGNLYGKRGDYELARRYLQRAVDHCADWQPIVFRTQIRNQLGDCLKALGDDAAAERLYREAARLAPPHSGVQELPRE